MSGAQSVPVLFMKAMECSFNQIGDHLQYSLVTWSTGLSGSFQCNVFGV